MNLVPLNVNQYTIWTADQLDGYGSKHLPAVIQNIVGCRQKPVKTCLEHFSGPGYIGLALLSTGFTERLVLADIHEPAREAVDRTIRDNNLHDKVEFICSDCFDNIPPQQFELIVGNPPHFNFVAPQLEEDDPFEEKRKHSDIDWKAHKKFYSQVKDYLAADGDIIMWENVMGSNTDTFQHMIQSNNLQITSHWIDPEWSNDVWYLQVTH